MDPISLNEFLHDHLGWASRMARNRRFRSVDCDDAESAAMESLWVAWLTFKPGGRDILGYAGMIFRAKLKDLLKASFRLKRWARFEHVDFAAVSAASVTYPATLQGSHRGPRREPCIDCGTDRGSIQKGRAKPSRIKGRCRDCDRKFRRGTLEPSGR